MKFDYFSCIQCKVVVSEETLAKHIGHDFLGEYFVIKQNKKKITPGLISKKLINAEKEKQNIERFNRQTEFEKKKKRLAQKRFGQQIPDGAVIVNLMEMKV